MIVYKIARIGNKKGDGSFEFESMVAQYKAKVIYEIKKVSTPPKEFRERHYGLLCYASKKIALDSIGPSSLFVLLKCRTKYIRKKLPICLYLSDVERAIFDASSGWSWPPHTIMVPWLKPIGEVRR